MSRRATPETTAEAATSEDQYEGGGKSAEFEIDEQEWGKPATKGDVARALIAVRGVLIHLRGIDVSAAEGNRARLIKELRSFNGHDRAIVSLMRDLVGKRDGS